MRTPKNALPLALFLSALPTAANNVFVFPTFTGSATGTALVYSGEPLAQTATFSVGTDVFAIFAKSAAVPADTKYYAVARSGSNSLVILNSGFQPIGQPISFGQSVTAAGLSPDGRRLLIMAGNLRIYNTDTDQEIQTNFIDVGIQPSDLAFSPDSRRAFLLSPLAQRLTAVDLTTNTAAGNISLPGITSGFVSTGPNGLLYVSAQTRVLEVNPQATPFDVGATRRQFTPLNANIGKLFFTPDGTRALAINLSPQSGTLLYHFSLDLLNPGIAEFKNTEAAFTAVAFEKLFIAGNSTAYAITASTSAQPRRLYTVTLPELAADGAPAVPTVAESFFGSLGNVSIADQVAVSSEYPAARRAYISAPLNLLQQAAQNTLYNVNLAPTTPNVTGRVDFNFLPGAVGWAGPAAIASTDAPTGLIRYNARQPVVAINSRITPIGVRVLGASGRPLFNVPVVFTPITPGAVLDGATTVFTNANGQAFIGVTAPAATGTFTINAAVSGSGLSTSFTFDAQTSGSGGGGSGGGTGSGTLNLVSGDGQVVRDGNVSLNEYVVSVTLPNGQPAVNVPVNWAITQGLGDWIEGTTVDGLVKTTLTNSTGLARNKYRAGSVAPGNEFQYIIMSASSGGASLELSAIAYLGITSTGDVNVSPSIEIQAPVGEPFRLSGRVGQTLAGAVRVRVNSPSGIRMERVGVSISTGLTAAQGPVATCTPRPVVLTNTEAVATCDVRLSGRAASGIPGIIDIGGFSIRNVILDVQPGEPGGLRIISGNSQTGNPNQNLLGLLIVELDDGGGNRLAGANIRWEVIQGVGTLTQSVTTTDLNGRASNTLRLGNAPGTVLVRATATGGTQPSVTFEARVNIVAAQVAKVSGDNQRTFTGTPFAQPLVVSVVDAEGRAVPGVPVNFAVTGGSATLSATTVQTDTNGRAQVTVNATANPGAIVVEASAANVAQRVTFNLISDLPGPVVNPLDMFNAASGERGAIVPGGIYNIVGGGLAPDLRGCITPSILLLGGYPTRLGNVEVQFGNTLAPIISLCNLGGRQSVTVQVPFELAAGGTVSATIRVGGGSSVVNNIQVVDLQPGIFETVDAQGRRYAVALRPNGTFVTPENPAQYRENIRFYITGAGPVTPGANTGATGIPGQRINAETVVGLNDAGARLIAAHYAVGMVGVYEIIFEIPEGTTTGANRPLGLVQIRSNGQTVFPGNSPTIAVAP